MDLLLIARKLWRYKLATVPIIALTFLGATYVVLVKKPLYEATASYLLISPPAPPTPDQIARDPALGRIRTDNPYTRFSDGGVVIDVLSRSLNSESAREALVKAGADSRYMVGSGAQFGSSTPIVQITGTGATPDGARQTAGVVGHALTAELARMQRAQGVASDYRITTLPVEVADTAQLRASGQLRMLVGVLALGGIMLFVAVSVLDAIFAILSPRRARGDELAPDPEGYLSPDLDAVVESRIASSSHREGVPTVASTRTAAARRVP